MLKDIKVIPVEDIAVNTLLDIDLKQQQDLNIWEQRTSQKVNIKHKNSVSLRSQPLKQIQVARPYNENTNDTNNLRSNLDKQLMRLSSDDFTFQNTEKYKLNQKMSKSSQFNEGELWLSKMNCIQTNNKRQHSIKTKLNKKLSFSYESNNRKNQNRQLRYESNQQINQRQNNKNLVYSLLTHKNLSRFKNQLEIKNIRQFCQFQSLGNKNKVSLNQLKNKGKPKLNNQVQQYMRQTLKRIYHKNQKSESFGNQKSPQHEKSSMIRQLLINLENVKDCQNNNSFQEVIPPIKYNKKQLNILESTSNSNDYQLAATKLPQKRFNYHINQKHVLNLNEQAEKQYKNKHNNFWNIKKQILVKI